MSRSKAQITRRTASDAQLLKVLHDPHAALGGKSAN
jgi:hypothetical protein